MRVALIAAVAANGVIGADGGLPWHLPEDLEHFKATTMGHPVVMGRRTFESIVGRIDGPLPGRTNVVLSSGDPDLPEGAVHADSVEAALAAARETGTETAYVAGGASVYEQFLPRADRLLITELDDSYEGDASFPEWNREAFREVERDERDGFAFVVYERRNDGAPDDGESVPGSD
jgi:dihydrofolate reductase